jgi:hypothetical protein
VALAPHFDAARIVVGLPGPNFRGPDQDEMFMRAVRNEFPNTVNYQRLPSEASAQIPYLILQSTAARLSLSRQGAQVDVRFYGEFSNNFDACRKYLERKTQAVFDGFRALETIPSFVGIVVTSRYSFKGEDRTPIAHMLATHIRVDPGDNSIQDGVVKVSSRVDDRYYLLIQLATYEQKTVERAIFPGMTGIEVKPWEGNVEDSGIQVEVDVNNRLQAISEKRDPRVGPEDLANMFAVVERGVLEATPEFLERGQLPRLSRVEKKG